MHSLGRGEKCSLGSCWGRSWQREAHSGRVVWDSTQKIGGRIGAADNYCAPDVGCWRLLLSARNKQGQPERRKSRRRGEVGLCCLHKCRANM